MVFQIGEWIWLKLQAYRQTSIQHKSNTKLGPKFFCIVNHVGQVAYKLNLPTIARIHETMHVSQLNPLRGQLPHLPYIPEWLQD